MHGRRGAVKLLSGGQIAADDRKQFFALAATIMRQIIVDEIRYVSAEQATSMARRLARECGIFAGMSSGGATHVALGLAQSIEDGLLVCILCDRGDRYLSSDLYGG